MSVVEYRETEYRNHQFQVSFCYFGLDTVPAFGAGVRRNNTAYSTNEAFLKQKTET
jgi:hypothetical protein